VGWAVIAYMPFHAPSQPFQTHRDVVENGNGPNPTKSS
jgi:hypothetical protein